MAVVTAKGRELVWNRMQGNGSEPKNLAWGNNPNSLTEDAADVAMFKEAAESRVPGTSTLVTTTTTSDTYQVTGTFTSGSAQTIAEVGLSDSASKPAATTLSSGINNSVTSLTVASASGFPGSGNYYIQIDSEVMQVTGGQGTTTWTVTRGALGTTGASHSSGATVTGGNAPGSTAVTNGSLLFHSAHGAQVLANGDQVSYTLKIQLT
jgi:hypothetical protein